MHIFVFIYEPKLTETLGYSIAENINAKNRATLLHPNQLYALDLRRRLTTVHVEGIRSPPHHLPTRYSTHSLHALTALTLYPLATPFVPSRTLRVRTSVRQNATPGPAHLAPSRLSARADAERRQRAWRVSKFIRPLPRVWRRKKFFAINHVWLCVRVVGTSVEDYVAHSHRLLSI